VIIAAGWTKRFDTRAFPTPAATGHI